MMTLNESGHHQHHTPDNTGINYSNYNTSPSVAATNRHRHSHSAMFPPARSSSAQIGSSPPQAAATFNTFTPLMPPQTQTSGSNYLRNNNNSNNQQTNPGNIWNNSNGSFPHVQRRHSAIDANIWSQGPTSTFQPTTNIWSSSGPSPNQENYTSSLSNRSSSISGFTPPPLEEHSNQQKQAIMNFQSGSPSQLLDPGRRHSFAESLPTTNSITAGSNNGTVSILNGGIDSNQTLKLVDEYFETDPHERVKVTLRLLNERFFDEEKYLGDAYQLPKFPIESSLRNYQLILVGFKAGRIDVFYLPSNNPPNSDLNRLKVGDLVIVEADRGRDLGKVFKMNISIDEARLLKLLQFQEQQAALNEHDNILDDLSVKNLSDSSNSIAPPTLHFPKSIISLAQPNEIMQILNKKQDEEKACRLCLAKIANATSSQQLMGANSSATQDLLQMKLIDAEYQFDRKKLIFYYSTSKRIDFRDLVRELFRIYKTRIWMCAVIGLPYNVNRKSVSPLMNGATSNPFMQTQVPTQNTPQPQQQPQQIAFSRGFERRLSYQPPPTFQQYPNVANPPPHLQQAQQQQQIPHPFQDGIPRRYSDSRPFSQQSQYAMFQGQQMQASPMNQPQLSPFQTDFQFPPPHPDNRNEGTIREEEDLNNNSGEAFVLKSLVDSINH